MRKPVPPATVSRSDAASSNAVCASVGSWRVSGMASSALAMLSASKPWASKSNSTLAELPKAMAATRTPPSDTISPRLRTMPAAMLRANVG